MRHVVRKSHLKKQQQIKLDFSGGPKSWFDLWHTHVDWDGEGNGDWEKRKQFINELLNLYEEYKIKLKEYPLDFQLWITIDDSDSGQDAVYIHSKNPNSDNFPINVPGNSKIRTQNKELKVFLKNSSLEIIKYEPEDGSGDIYYLYDKKIGIKLN